MSKVIGAFLTVLLAVGSLALPASAEEGQELPSPSIKPKSESRAFTASLVGSLVTWGLLLGASATGSTDLGAVGFFSIPLGPSLGYFGAGLTGRAFGGIGIRCIGLLGVVGGFLLAWEDENPGLGAGLMIWGAATTAASTIYDLATIKRAVRKRNLRLGERGLNVVPVVSPKTKTVGLNVQFGF